MRYRIKLYWLISCFIFLLPGCGRIVDWAKDSFCQGCDLSDYSKVPRQFLRSTTVYDQFETLGAFDVLWLSGSVRTAYSQLHACRYGKTMEHEMAFLRRQLEANKHYIDFYVLSLYGKPLDMEDSMWSLFLEIDGRQYGSMEIHDVITDFPPEYKFFFGKRFSKFKVPYMVRFNAHDVENRLLIDEETTVIKLIFRSVEKEVVLSWDLKVLPCTSKLVECECKERENRENKENV